MSDDGALGERKPLQRRPMERNMERKMERKPLERKMERRMERKPLERKPAEPDPDNS